MVPLLTLFLVIPIWEVQSVAQDTEEEVVGVVVGFRVVMTPFVEDILQGE